MKTAVRILFMFGAIHACRAQWAVIDAANLNQSVTNYAIMVQQVAKQAEQVTNQVRQIQQMEDRLKRLGSMAGVKAIVGFPNLHADLNLPSRIEVWAQSITRVNGRSMFGDTRDGVFEPISAEYPTFDGTMVVREPAPYKPEQEVTASVDEFKQVQADVLARRTALRRAIAQTSEALQNADTDAEEQKLSAILQSEYSELAAIDSEMALSADEIQARRAEASAMTQARQQADAEARGTLADQETDKLTNAFRPTYQSVLSYLNERPFRP